MTSTPILLLELTSVMGQALFKIQKAEQILKQALQWVGADANATLAGLEARERSLQRATLGNTLRMFKSRIAFADDFEIGMREFLDNRNLFAHDFLSLPGFSISSDAEIAVGIEFLRKLINQADVLARVMQGLNQMLVNSGTTPDGTNDITDEKMNEMFALMMLRPKP